MREKTPQPTSGGAATRAAASKAPAPGPQAAEPVLRLQRQVGNQATGELLGQTLEPATEAPAAQEERPPGAPAPGSLLVEDGAELAGGQMAKGDFLAELEAAACAAAEAGLAGTERSAAGCPWIGLYVQLYAGRTAGELEAELLRYAPETRNVASAREYVPLIAARIFQSTKAWADTGEVTGVPEGVPAGLPGMSVLGAMTGMFFKADGGGGAAPSSPRAVEARLGEGRPLSGAARGRMEGALGRDLGDVEIHADATAARLSRRFGARAFTVGSHVAFGSGEYRPGTVVGDALLAHELAHVVQQGRGREARESEPGTGAYRALEADADRSAVGATAALWAGAGRRVAPTLRSGLRLQRCDDKKQEAPKTAAKADEEPQLLKDFAAKFADAAELIRKSPEAMKLVVEAAAAGAKFGGYSEEGPAKWAWPYTSGDKVYVPKSRTDKIVAMSDFLFELNNAIRAPKFGELEKEAAKGSVGKLTAKEYAKKNIELEVEGMLRMGEIWFKMKNTIGKGAEWNKYDNDFFLEQYKEFKDGKKTKDDIVKEVLQWKYSVGKHQGKTHEQYYIEQYNQLSGGK